MDKYTGKKLDGRYEINELIGVGGMAMVYRAYDVIDDRTVAIKILKDEFLNNADFIRRFRNESKAIAVMSHPNIVKVFDVSFGDMIQYIVMEYIDGITLKEYIAQRKEISWKESLHFTVQILHALQHAHEKGIIHRDIKPQNIMLLQDGTIKVTDFGIARFSNKETRTMTERAIGSVHYIAPEQARGDITDNKSDLYSVGVMLYEMLTGKLPFEADNAVSVAIMQLQNDPEPPKAINPSIPDGLEEITLRAMQKDGAKRYQSAEDMLSDIELFRQNPSIKFQYTYFDDDLDTKYADAITNARSTIYDDNFDTISYEETEEATTKKSPMFSIIIGIVSAFVLVGGIFAVLALFRSCSGETAADVDVPNLIGMNFKEDVENNSDYIFRWNIESAFDETQPIGVILEQKPSPGSKKIKQGSEITLTVNSSETNTTVPNIIGLQQNDAINRITKNSLNYEVVEVIDDNTAEGYVVSSSPKPGTEVYVDSTVRIYISSGTTIEQIEVPYLVDCTLSEAQNKLNELGLLFGGCDYEENEAEKDTVISQNPLWGSKVSKGTKVTVTISLGPSQEVELRQTVPMPNYNADVTYRVIVDDSNVIRDITINPAQFTDNVIVLTGKADSKNQVVTVELNGHVYRQYTFNYKDNKIIVDKELDFIPPQPPAQDTDTDTDLSQANVDSSGETNG